MRQKIKNTISLEVAGLDLTTITNIEFYIKQGSRFWQLTPVVVSSTEMYVVFPKEDAMGLSIGNVKLQFAYTQGNLTNASDIAEIAVAALLKEAGYGG